MFLHSDKIKKSTQKRLDNHGIKIEINSLDDAESPRDLEGVQSYMVGIDGDMPNLSMKDKPLDWVKALCLNVYDFTEQELVWSVVDCVSFAGHDHYKIGSKDDGWIDGVGHIVFIAKADWLSEVGAEVFTDEMEIEVSKRLEKEVNDYNAWLNDEVYEIQISSDIDGTLLGRHGLFSHQSYIYQWGDVVDDIINEMLDEVVGYINTNDTFCTVKVTMSSVNKTELSKKSVRPMLDNIKKNFGFTPIIGRSDIGKDGKSITFNLWTNSMPDFLSLLNLSDKASKVNKNNGLDVIEKISGTMSVDKKLEFLAQNIGNNKQYNYWDKWDFSQLIKLIFASGDQSYAHIVTHQNNENLEIKRFKEHLVDIDDLWLSALLSAYIERVGGDANFINQAKDKKSDKDGSPSYIGFTDVSDRLAFFDSNRSSLVKFGRRIAYDVGRDSLMSLIYQHVNSVGIDHDDIALVLGGDELHASKESSSVARIASSGLVVLLAYDHLNRSFKDFTGIK